MLAHAADAPYPVHFEVRARDLAVVVTRDTAARGEREEERHHAEELRVVL